MEELNDENIMLSTGIKLKSNTICIKCVVTIIFVTKCITPLIQYCRAHEFKNWFWPPNLVIWQQPDFPDSVASSVSYT